MYVTPIQVYYTTVPKTENKNTFFLSENKIRLVNDFE
jgi:hypothetical protein